MAWNILKGIPRRTSRVLLTRIAFRQYYRFGHEVRLIDMFVESIEMGKSGFASKPNAEGRPAYNPKDLLKLFIYGFLKCILPSSVRKSAGAIPSDVAVATPAPDHNTTALNFRKDNQKPSEAFLTHRAHSKTISQLQ
ncbi:MAG: hypothetical protein IPG29_10790 [Sphingobacteriales bacterium]|nr:hypothetical protein [Sphingobacteriales bacterium]